MPQLGESVAEGTIGKWLKQPGDSVAKYEPLLEVITDKVNAEVPSPFEGTLTEILVQEGETVPNNADIAVIETADEGGASAGAPASPAAAAGSGASDPGAQAPSSAPPDAGASEKPADASESDTGGPYEAVAESAADHGPAGSDERSATEAPASAPAAGATPTPPAAPTAGIAAGGAPALHAAAQGGATPTATAPGTSNGAADGAIEGAGNADARMTPAVRRLLREHGLTAAQIVGSGGGGRIPRDDVSNY